MVRQLNINNLLTPLLYTEPQQGSSTSSNPQNPNAFGSTEQMQAAINYIQYATSQVTPIPQPDFKDMINLYNSKDKDQAQAAIAKYLTSLRSYAALMSVAPSNLYYILSKRMPQKSNQQDPSTGKTSEALNEFNMATRRLNDVKNPKEQNWSQQISGASPATVQKEIAMLLAEMNYQLYLSRQQQERILLTQTIMMLQNSRFTQPNPALKGPATGGGDTGNSGS